MNYKSCMDLCVFPFKIKEKNKVRTIITYQNTDMGNKYREHHEKILRKLEKLPSSMYSFAYKKGICTRNAVEPHMSSNLFIKMDIKSFFESITYDSFMKETRCTIKGIEDCFYDAHLSLGFVTSPRISDIFMYNFDKKIEDYLKANPSLRYSRYCDDILISEKAEDFGALHTFKSYIQDCLSVLGLEINKKKVFEFDFEKHTSATFLGLNIVPAENGNIITISKPFLVDTLNQMEECMKLKEKIDSMRPEIHNRWMQIKKNECDEEFKKESRNVYYSWKALKKRLSYERGIALSRVSYIRTNSEYSYTRLCKKYKNRFNTNIEEF